LACALVIDFDLGVNDAFQIMKEEFNPRCQPPWNDHELWHKVTQADAKGGPRGKLLRADRNGRAAAPAPPPSLPSGAGESPLELARLHAASVPRAASEAERYKQANDLAVDLVVGCDLSFGDAQTVLTEWNKGQSPFSEQDLFQIAEDAYATGRERGYLLGADRGDPGADAAEADQDGEGLLPSDRAADPARLAWRFLKQYEAPDGFLTFRRWQGDCYVWDAGCWKRLPDEEVKDALARFIDEELERQYTLAMAAFTGEEGERPPRKQHATEKAVRDTLRQLGGFATLPVAACPAQPAWIEPPRGAESWAAHDVLPARNALVHLPSYTAGATGFSIAPTPRYFNSHCLDYDFNPDAPRPTAWLAFLGQLWPDDPDSVNLLQEWMGLQLVPDTSYQKMMMLIGPRRAGKGTIARVTRGMVGVANCCGPTLSSFGQNFGLSPLIDKLTAIIDDARLSGKSDQAVIVERLLTITGEGDLTVDRKYKSPMTCRLPTRITLISNELPRLGDSSGALANRFLLLRFRKSFEGHEDIQLDAKLAGELPGILLWALEGLRRLRERGRFVQPEASNGLHRQMQDLSSPIGEFVSDWCLTGREFETGKDFLYRAWVSWCGQTGRVRTGDIRSFAKELYSVLPELEEGRKREGGGQRHRTFVGVGLRPEYAEV
jgi:putative DNA primase/helicase